VLENDLFPQTSSPSGVPGLRREKSDVMLFFSFLVPFWTFSPWYAPFPWRSVRFPQTLAPEREGVPPRNGKRRVLFASPLKFQTPLPLFPDIFGEEESRRRVELPPSIFLVRIILHFLPSGASPQTVVKEHLPSIRRGILTPSSSSRTQARQAP